VISAFGPRAEAYAAGMADIDAVVVEPAQILSAYFEAVRRRTLGESFYTLLMLEENRDREMTRLAPEVLMDSPDPDRRRAILYGVAGGKVVLNGKPGTELLDQPNLGEPTLRTGATELLSLSPALLVRSVAEYHRVSAFTRRTRPYELILVEPVLPSVDRQAAERPGIVLWAPERNAMSVALYAFALSEAHADVTVVSADGVGLNGATALTLRVGDPRVTQALATATCIVLCDATDPGAAVAFARRGYGIVAPISSGAQEFVQNAYLYDPAEPRNLHVGAMMALAQPASLRVLPEKAPRVPARPALPVDAREAPPATIVVPTFNRRDDLGRCLDCIGAQTYPNVRAIVVNDAGERVDDVVARYPFARLVDQPTNGGAIRACMTGLELVQDGFVQFLADDDWLYPDHVDRLVTAMLRSGAGIAHSNLLIHYIDRLENGAVLTSGYNCSIFIETATPSEALVCTPIAGHAIMWRRSVLDEIGGWREDCDLADQEVQLRALQRYAFVFVDQVTAEWRIHGENFSGKADSGAEQRRIYDVLHPLPDRPLITKTRNQVLENIASRPPGAVFPPTIVMKR
jgi:hypothetical protein